MIYATISGPRGKQTPSPSSASARRPRHPLRHRHPQRHRPRLQSRRRPLRHLARRGQRLPHRRRRRVHRLRRRHGRRHRRCLRRRGQSLRRRPQRHHLQDRSPSARSSSHATLEPSVAAYHLAVNAAGTLFVTAPSLSPPTTPSGPSSPTATPAPGIAASAVPRASLSKEGDVYSPPASTAAAAWSASPATAKLPRPRRPNLVGVAFSPLGTTILATNEAVMM
jgi:hypothetical protein